MSGEGVAQKMRMDSLRFEPGFPGETAQDEERTRARERPTLRIEEELWPVSAVEVGTAAGQVAAERIHCLTAHGDQALLSALADAADDAVVEVDRGPVEATGL